MKHFCTNILIAALAISGTQSAFSQTKTVSKDGTKDFTSVQAALGFFNPDPDPATPNIIQITDSDLYEEVITVNVPVTLEGTGSSRPRLALQANSNGRAGSAGLVISLPSTTTTETVILKNLNLIPSKSTPPSSCAVSVVNNNLFLLVENVVITANDGNDFPLTETGLTNVASSGSHVNFGDDGIVAGGSTGGEFEGSGVEVFLRNTIISHLRGIASGTSDGVLIEAADTSLNRSLHLADGNVFSYNNGKGIDVYGDIDMSAPAVRNIFAGNASFGMWLHVSPNYRNIRNAVIASNQVGIYESTPSGVNATIEDTIVANNGRQGIRVSNSPSTPLTMRRVTFANQTGSSYEAIRIDGGSADLLLENCIIAGNGNVGNINCLNNLGTGNIIVIDSALVNAGPRSLDVPVAYPAYLSGKIVSYCDPQFENMTDFTLSTFYDVSSSVYANIGSVGAPLAGGAHYTGPAAPAPATDQVITVSKTSAANFTTLQSALSSLTSDITKNYIIQILDNSIYDEVLTMNVPATIIGTGTNRPVLAVQANSAGFDNDGTGATAENAWSGDAGLLIDIPIATTTCTVSLQNLIIIPSRNSGPVVAGIVNKANNFFLNLENVLVTSNDGSDNPINIDGLNYITNSSEVSFVVSGAHIGSITNNRLEGEGVEVLMRNCTFTNIHGYDGGTWRSGFYMYRTYYVTTVAPGAGESTRLQAFRMLTIDGSSKFTYNHGSGLRTAASLFAKSTADPIYFVGNTYQGLWLDMQKGYDFVDGTRIANNSLIFDSDLVTPGSGSGINEGVGQNGPRVQLSNAIVANNGAFGTYNRQGASSATGQLPTVYQNVTLANNGELYDRNTLQTSPNNHTISLRTRDTIIAGTGTTTHTANLVNLIAQGTFTLSNTALVTNGNFALIDPPVIGIATVSGTAISNADPDFANTVDPFHPQFYAVRNTDYATLNSAGGPLSGGGLYAPLSAVKDWSVY